MLMPSSGSVAILEPLRTFSAQREGALLDDVGAVNLARVASGDCAVSFGQATPALSTEARSEPSGYS